MCDPQSPYHTTHRRQQNTKEKTHTVGANNKKLFFFTQKNKLQFITHHQKIMRIILVKLLEFRKITYKYILKYFKHLRNKKHSSFARHTDRLNKNNWKVN